MISWIHLLFNFCTWMVWMTVFMLLFERKLPLYATLLIEAAAFIPYYFIVQFVLTDYSVLRLFLGELIVLTVPLLLYRGKIIEKLLIKLGILLFSLISDMFVYYIGTIAPFSSSQESLSSFPVWQYVLAFLISASLNSLLVLGGLALRRNKEWMLTRRDFLMLAAFPVCQMILIVHWLYILWNDSERYGSFPITVPFLLCILADGMMFYLCYRIGMSSAVREKVRLLEEKNALLENRYRDLAEDFERIASIRKDLSDQWKRILSQVERGLSEEAILEIEQTQADRDASILPGCRNRIVSVFLKHRMERMNEAGIDTDFSVSMPADIGISNPKLISIYGNLLDNASEACEKAEHPKVVLKTDYAPPYLRIRVENPYEKGLVRRKRIPELERGVGTTILNKIADLYDGNYHTENKNGIFIVSMMLKGERNSADDRRM